MLANNRLSGQSEKARIEERWGSTLTTFVSAGLDKVLWAAKKPAGKSEMFEALIAELQRRRDLENHHRHRAAVSKHYPVERGVDLHINIRRDGI